MYEKTEHSKIKCFLHISRETDIHAIPKTQNMMYKKSMGKHKHFKFMDFLNISGEAEIHTIPKTWGNWISIVQEKCGKTNVLNLWVS